MATIDRITLTILADGTAKITTEGISGANHMSADALLSFFSKAMGGNVEVVSSGKEKHAHTHEHSGITHSH